VDDGFIALNGNGNGTASAFLGACARLPIRERELAFV
jgi:hypothetical protein